MVNWLEVATIATPIFAAILSVWATRRFERRPILLAHFGHVSGTTVARDEGPVTINHHSVVIRNTGRRRATNVRLTHHVLPDFNIWPSVQYSIEDLPQGGKDIVIPVLTPGEQLNISYIYFGPTTVNDINAGVKCDQGIATPIPMLLQRQYPKWLNLLVRAIFLVGIVASVYLLYEVFTVLIF